MYLQNLEQLHKMALGVQLYIMYLNTVEEMLLGNKLILRLKKQGLQ